jgi:UDP-glucose 4-epimerase
MKGKKIMITGGAGFIGSRVAKRLVNENTVTVIDNLSTGKMKNIETLMENRNFKFIHGDATDRELLSKSMQGTDIVFHLASSVDVRKGEKDVISDLESYLATHCVLEAMRANGVHEIVFTSSSTVYGDAAVIPTPENYAGHPISLYGASKLASEALISAYCHMFGMHAWTFRLANIIGGNGHGILLDFYEKLKADSTQITILGDGMQKKSYLYAEDCIDAILFAAAHSNDILNVFNVGSEDSVTVNRITDIVLEEMDLADVRRVYTGGQRGWKGDTRAFHLAVDKIKKLGWSPKRNSEESIRLAIREIIKS